MYQPDADYMRIPMLVMPQGAQQTILNIYMVLAVAMLGWAAWRSRREGSLKPFLYVLGGGMACFVEPVLARMADATHAQIGQITAKRWTCVFRCT